MSFPPAAEADAPTLAAPAAAAAREPEEVEYPEGQWVAQSLWHGDAVQQAATALKHHFRERRDTLVGMEVGWLWTDGQLEVR
jgi:hypothetical protein